MPPSPLSSLLLRSSRQTILRLSLLLLLLLSSLPSSLSKKASSRRRKSVNTERETSGSSYSRFVTTLKITYILLFLPVLLIFAWSIYRDPAVSNNKHHKCKPQRGSKQRRANNGKGRNVAEIAKPCRVA